MTSRAFIVGHSQYESSARNCQLKQASILGMASTCYVMPPEGMILITDKLLKMIGMHRGWKRVTGNISEIHRKRGSYSDLTALKAAIDLTFGL
jgi:hypothetical protein